MRWYWGDPVRSVWHDASLHTAVVQTLKLGVLTTVDHGAARRAVRDRHRPLARPAARDARTALMLLSFVIPETLLAVALLFLITIIAVPFYLGTTAQVDRSGDLPAVLSGGPRARPAGDDRARSTRRPPRTSAPRRSDALRRVILPMLTPAIFASTVLVFADVIDDFVIVRYLSGDASTEPASVKIYNTARAAPTPALNALATILLATALLVVAARLRASTACSPAATTQPTAASAPSPARSEPCPGADSARALG